MSAPFAECAGIIRLADDAQQQNRIEYHLTTYDAVCVASAEALDAPLLTCDAKIAAAPAHHALVEVV